MSVRNRNHIMQDLRSKIAELVDNPELADKLQPDASIHEAGVDSIVFINLIVRIEQEFKVTFPGDELAVDRFGTLNQIADRIYGKRTVTSR
ncbi:acyl carrier protein [Cohnella suwonensis]|uniref:Acyl carrier protein n=1 Tax=Cohnella suwonensis TaxID=696072 RepID=A0ABW0LTH3_9BACL